MDESIVIIAQIAMWNIAKYKKNKEELLTKIFLSMIM